MLMTAVVCALALTAQAQNETVIRVDFGDDNQAPKVGFVDGGTWNTIVQSAGDPNADAYVGQSPDYEMKDTNTNNTGITIGSYTGTWNSTSANNQDGQSFTGTDFGAAVGHDVLFAANAGDAVGFTLNGFNPGDTVSIRLAAAAGAGGDPNVADFTFAGSFGDSNLGDDFDVLANSAAASGAGVELTWTLSGSTSYAFVMDTDTGRGGINGMILTVTPAPRGLTFVIR